MRSIDQTHQPRRASGALTRSSSAKNIIMKNPVCLGDATTHGGVVKTASSTFMLDGRKVALLHDIVSCPEHGDNRIVESGGGYREAGRAWVVDRCRTQCGSHVIAQSTGMSIE
ncbi:MAG: PAAR domain-containing protein [Burkholderia sp.]